MQPTLVNEEDFKTTAVDADTAPELPLTEGINDEEVQSSPASNEAASPEEADLSLNESGDLQEEKPE